MNYLTGRQQQALDCIITYKEKYGFPPSHVELAAMLNVKSSKAASDFLKALEKKGYIKIHWAVPRGITVLQEDPDYKKKYESLVLKIEKLTRKYETFGAKSGDEVVEDLRGLLVDSTNKEC